MGTKKKARSEERKRVFFFVFWRERFVCLGGEAFNSLSRLFTSSNDDNV